MWRDLASHVSPCTFAFLLSDIAHERATVFHASPDVDTSTNCKASRPLHRRDHPRLPVHPRLRDGERDGVGDDLDARRGRGRRILRRRAAGRVRVRRGSGGRGIDGAARVPDALSHCGTDANADFASVTDANSCAVLQPFARADTSAVGDAECAADSASNLAAHAVAVAVAASCADPRAHARAVDPLRPWLPLRRKGKRLRDVHHWTVRRAARAQRVASLCPQLHALRPWVLQQHDGCDVVPALRRRIAQRGGSYGVSALRGWRVQLQRQRVPDVPSRHLCSASAGRSLPSLRSGKQHRQRHQRGDDLHALQLGVLE